MRKVSIITALAVALAMPVAFAQTQSYPQNTTQPQQTQPAQPNDQTQTTQPTQTYPQTTQPSQQQTYPSPTQTQQSQPQQTQSYPQTTQPTDQSTQPQVTPRTAEQANQQQQEVVNSANPGEIPAGTDLFIRADENINTQTSDAQHTYQGTVTRQIVDANGRMLIPKGTPVQLSVMENSGSMGSKNLVLGVNSMNIKGHTYAVTSDQVTKSAGNIGGDQGIGANKRTATHVGGGAVLGTLLGAVVGGGKGAAIGAVTGAAAGGAVQVLTNGKKINVPAETELQFHLDQPIRLQAY
ncbi:MAG: hypothetical protein JWO13_1982 [Acidobacteriales bacterium]|nr:hypothetical protein [Terriglobales bacterium]